MKKTKRFISFLLVIQMMLICMLIPGVAATDVVTETPIESEKIETVLAIPADVETEISVKDLAQNELTPMAARRCGYQYSNLPQLFKDLGYSYEGNSHPYTLNGGYTYSMSPGGSHDYQVVVIWDANGNQMGMYTCLHA